MEDVGGLGVEQFGLVGEGDLEELIAKNEHY